MLFEVSWWWALESIACTEYYKWSGPYILSPVNIKLSWDTKYGDTIEFDAIHVSATSINVK